MKGRRSITSSAVWEQSPTVKRASQGIFNLPQSPREGRCLLSCHTVRLGELSTWRFVTGHDRSGLPPSASSLCHVRTFLLWCADTSITAADSRRDSSVQRSSTLLHTMTSERREESQSSKSARARSGV